MIRYSSEETPKKTPKRPDVNSEENPPIRKKWKVVVTRFSPQMGDGDARW